MTGLYVHVPFCQKRCHYCDFVVTTDLAEARRRGYLEAVAAESRHRAASLGSRVFDTLYLGGGTPSVLTAGEMERLFEAIRASLSVRDGAEITLEMNPSLLDEDKLRRWRTLGVSRVSLGAQVFDDTQLASVNREHTAGDIDRCFRLLRDHGYDDISLDLILSLPGETEEVFERTLERTLELAPDHVSLYELVVEPKTVFGRRMAAGRLERPDEQLQLDRLRRARRTLTRAGYEHYELLSYARPGHRSVHNRIYWDNQEYLGLGPGAYSYWEGRRYRTAATLEEYLARAASGDWSASEQETLSAPEREVESLLLALRLLDGVELSRFRSVLDRKRATVDALIDKELLTETPERLRLTERGIFFAETVFSELSGD
ncbi:MAG: Oxygen-independent coproporphyrinogen-III oxidase-like protein [Candidatus Omnitrophica bacterium]|nr:Oxygen-independent coproporphyrinogen-III oxidase-like protein [Candidatus Omnitrophota bacterium]